MPEPLLLSFRSEASRRTLIIADEGDSVWAYLTEAGTLRPVRDCWLLNTPTATDAPDLERYRAEGRPPPAPASQIDAAGVKMRRPQRVGACVDRWMARSSWSRSMAAISACSPWANGEGWLVI